MRLLKISHLVLQQKCRRLALSSLQGCISVRGNDQCGVVINLKTPMWVKSGAFGSTETSLRCKPLLGGLFQSGHAAREASLISCGGGIAVPMGWGVG
jgi:hypothetical protein